MKKFIVIFNILLVILIINSAHAKDLEINYSARLNFTPTKFSIGSFSTENYVYSLNNQLFLKLNKITFGINLPIAYSILAEYENHEITNFKENFGISDIELFFSYKLTGKDEFLIVRNTLISLNTSISLKIPAKKLINNNYFGEEYVSLSLGMNIGFITDPIIIILGLAYQQNFGYINNEDQMVFPGSLFKNHLEFIFLANRELSISSRLNFNYKFNDVVGNSVYWDSQNSITSN